MINLGVLKNFNRAKKYPKGTIIANDNSGDTLYIMLIGEAGIFLNYHKQNQELISSVGPGDYFGETAFFLEKNKNTSTVALTDVIALPITKNDTAAFIKEEPDMTLEIMKAMCLRLDSIGDAYEKLAGRPWAEPKSAPITPPTKAPAKTPAKTPVKAPVAPAANLHAPAPTSAPATLIQSKSVHSSLFPEGHGSYQLPLNNEDAVHLFKKNYTCPICHKDFITLKVRTSKLVLDKTDSDMRTRYKGFEPLYYEIITCPHCMFSALTDMFDHPDKPNAGLPPELQAFLSESKVVFGEAMDTTSVFAGYYLALICIPHYFSKHQLITPKLLLKLSRIYQDCGDKRMEDEMAKQALDAYMYAYLNIEIPPNQDQQLCIIMGELYLKLKEYKTAKDYFFKAKVDRAGIPRLQRHADNRILDIRELEGISPATDK